MLIVPALALVVMFSVLVTAVLRPPARPAAILSLYLLAYANIVLVGEVANSVFQLNNPWVWLGLHGVLAVGAWLTWRRRGRPSLTAPWRDAEGHFFPAGLRRCWKQWPELWLFTLGVSLVFLFSAVLIWVVPPNNNDSLATHMSRVAYWLQHGSFFPWPSQRTWQITYPVNMQLQMFWTILFLGSDRVVESVQWLGALAAMAAVFGLARLLGASRPQAWFSALVWATFPEIILESSTTQNDLVAGTLFGAMLYLFFLGLSPVPERSGRLRQAAMLALSGLALGLGLGTKQTLLFLLPGLGLVLLLVLYARGWGVLRSLCLWAASGLGAFLLLGAYMFVVNTVHFGHPMGIETAVDAQTVSMDRQALAANLSFNTFRLAYQAIDPTGLPDPLTGYGFKLKGLVTEKLLGLIHFPVEAPLAVAEGHQFRLRERYVLQEDAAWYGPLFGLLALPASFYQLLQGIKKKDALRVGIFLLGLSFLLVDAALRPGWDPFQGRYFIPTVIVTTPTLAFLARPGKKGALLRWGISGLALVIAVNTLILNSGKPLNGEYNVWQASRIDQVTLQSFFMRQPVHMVEAAVPADASLGLLTFGNFQEYPFFGENFSRRLVPIYPPERIQDDAWLKAQGVEYVLVLLPAGAAEIPMPAGLVPMAQVEDWQLWGWGPPN